uniref:Myozenin 1a n=1 Tax=Myripristis murdjan TaxID=586833 RepID=A0A667ZNS5_9TELE
MQSGPDDLTRQRMQQAQALCKEARGGLNLGKKMSVPKDVMMEELNLPSNRGSRTFRGPSSRSDHPRATGRKGEPDLPYPW